MDEYLKRLTAIFTPVRGLGLSLTHDAYLSQADICLDHNDAEHALKICAEGLKDYPDDPELLLTLSTSLLYLNRSTDAEAVLRHAVSKNPHDFDALYNLAQCLKLYASRDDIAAGEAAVHFELALELRPHHISCRNDYASMLMRLGEYESASSLYLDNILIDPDNVTALTGYSRARIKMGLNDNETHQRLKEAWARTSGYMPGYYLTRSLHRFGDLDKGRHIAAFILPLAQKDNARDICSHLRALYPNLDRDVVSSPGCGLN